MAISFRDDLTVGMEGMVAVMVEVMVVGMLHLSLAVLDPIPVRRLTLPLVYTFFFALTIYILKYKRPEAGYGNLEIIIMSVLFFPYWVATGIEYLIDKFYKK